MFLFQSTTCSSTTSNVTIWALAKSLARSWASTPFLTKRTQKSPTNLFPTQTVKHLPSTTYYAIRDAATDEYIIPFDNIYNKVSCDTTSNFIYVDMNSFMPERYYRIELKVIDGFTEEYIDDQIYFKVVR